MRKKYYCCRFYVTHKCNCSCSFCDTHSYEYSGHLPVKPDEAANIIHDVWTLGCRYIDFTGGEPALNPALPQLIMTAKSLGIKTEITTNGAQGMTDTLAECALIADKFNVSLDSLSREVYESLRGFDGLEHTLEVIREASVIRHKAGLPAVKIMTAVTKKNLNETEALVRFADEAHAEIYFNPVFRYFDECHGCDESDYMNIIPVLEKFTFRKNAVIMLHFLEFYSDSGDNMPLCSANRQTLTISADGCLILPCYHSGQKAFIDTGHNLKRYVQSREFEELSSRTYKQCKGCKVSPYFGISFSFRLDKFFLLASFSEKLVHLKRDYLNEFNLSFDENYLMGHLKELKLIINSLAQSPVPESDSLYYAEKIQDYWHSPVYRRRISCEDYERDLAASDCWGLRRIPHRFYDRICCEVFAESARCLRECPDDKESREILSLSQEFMLRWWKYYISVNFSTSVICDAKSESQWLDEYFMRIRDKFPAFMTHRLLHYAVYE